MLNYNYFTALFHALDEVQTKKLFIQLAHQYHPDKGGNSEIMQNLNTAYQTHLNKVRSGEIKERQDEIDRELIEKVNLISKYRDIKIEILGSWIWLTGNTKAHKEDLKSYGFSFAPKKEAWYYRREEDKKSHSRGDYSLDEIREKYSSKFDGIRTSKSKILQLTSS